MHACIVGGGSFETVELRKCKQKRNEIRLSINNWLVHIRLSIMEKFKSSILSWFA